MARKEHIPGKESKEGKGRVEGDVRVRAGRAVDLTTRAQAIERVEKTGTHEADETQHRDLGERMVVDALEPGRTLEDLRRGLRAIVAGAASVACLFADWVRHWEGKDWWRGARKKERRARRGTYI